MNTYAYQGMYRDLLKKFILERGALAHGDFTLASGAKSTYYFNSKKVLLHPPSMNCVASCFYDLTSALDPDRVGGLEVGAIPIAVMLAEYTYSRWRHHVESFYVRKQPKGHGSDTPVEGDVGPGHRVVVVDDVWTTGESTMKAVTAVEALGATVVGVVCLVNRLQGADELLSKYNPQSVFTIHDFGIEPEAT
jgi:orotate phosphoribosyltransferase